LLQNNELLLEMLPGNQSSYSACQRKEIIWGLSLREEKENKKQILNVAGFNYMGFIGAKVLRGAFRAFLRDSVFGHLSKKRRARKRRPAARYSDNEGKTKKGVQRRRVKGNSYRN